MRSALAKLKLAHLALAALLAATLWFSSAREAHSLCFRLLLHLKGDTFVRGQSSGCIIYTIPRVEFTPLRIEAVRNHSKDSIEAYALAAATGDYTRIESPVVDSSWTNHPLLEWMALRLVWISESQRDTNNAAALKLFPATAKSARKAVHLAQSVDATNGALWLAEACLDFDEGRDADALVALQIAASNKVWNANSSVSFSNLASLYQKAGLSELDAAGQANWVGADTSPLALQGSCSRHLERLMTKAINNNQDADFLRQLEILTGLRRAEWEDKNSRIWNSISIGRRYPDDLINAMAAKLGRKPQPTVDDKGYSQRRELSRQLFQDFFNQISDQRLAAIYLTQGERYRTEKRLRAEISENEYWPLLWWGLFASLAGMCAPLLLTLLVVLFVVELAAWKFDQTGMDFRVAMRQRKYLIKLSCAVLGFALLMSNYSVSISLNAGGGFGPIEPPPFIHPDVVDFLVWLAVPAAVILAAYLFGDKVRIQIKFKHGQLTAVAFGAYLILILLMAFCRHQLAGVLMS